VIGLTTGWGVVITVIGAVELVGAGELLVGAEDGLVVEELGVGLDELAGDLDELGTVVPLITPWAAVSLRFLRTQSLRLTIVIGWSV
jgi:hypothetical protein